MGTVSNAFDSNVSTDSKLKIWSPFTNDSAMLELPSPFISVLAFQRSPADNQHGHAPYKSPTDPPLSSVQHQDMNFGISHSPRVNGSYLWHWLILVSAETAGQLICWLNFSTSRRGWSSIGAADTSNLPLAELIQQSISPSTKGGSQAGNSASQ
ncbi:hypothetical protein PCASD_09534 [Puccinia coronata f. sp. avenae]|nr:hypothetical protein PCASD_09534 [Puccinia coronata f. sp. avenae]